MRIFWLGMHKLLVRTELQRIRSLGFEVFNPPYLSEVKDQSAELSWDKAQPTTLPPDVFQKLERYNFFYNPISPEIAELLNAYFDAVIVTINPDWLIDILRVYQKRIIYRTYGQPYQVSRYLWDNGASRAILDHPDFHFVPFHDLTVDLEHTWLAGRMSVVPYQIDNDVIALQDTWNIDAPRRKEIMITCPNIENPYYRAHYNFLKQNFTDPGFRFYGVQFKHPNDPQIVGTLSRKDYLKAYQDISGYLYTHGGPMVSYLPPIEMMMVGGPVLYLPHSLLARFFGKNAPGLALNPEDARVKARRLIEQDRGYISELIASQQDVRQLYHPDHVNPIFDRVMRSLLSAAPASNAPALIVNSQPDKPALPTVATTGRIYVLFHFPGGIITRRDHLYLSAEGIPRVVRLMVGAILAVTDFEIIITTRYAHAPFTMGFFGVGSTPRVKVHVIDDIPALGARASAGPSAKFAAALDSIGRKLGPASRKLDPLGRALIRMANAFFHKTGLEKRHADVTRERLPAMINADPACRGVIVPHYYLFPEAINMKAPLALYLPDYTPHFFQGTKAFANEDRHAQTGRAIADTASVIMTNSQFTRSYISDTVLKVAQEKIHVFPLPNLNRNQDETGLSEASLAREHVRVHTEGRPIIFYPTQNRPNKNIPLLLQILAELIARHSSRQLDGTGSSLPAGMPPVLVLTCSLDDFPPARQEYERLRLAPHVVFVSAATDADLCWIYKQAACLALTTQMEGNFPPQVVEALSYGTPVVASRIPLITEELGDLADNLLLVETSNVAKFVAKIEYAMTHREAVLSRQAIVHEQLMAARTPEKFNAALLRVVNELSGADRDLARRVSPDEDFRPWLQFGVTLRQ